MSPVAGARSEMLERVHFVRSNGLSLHVRSVGEEPAAQFYIHGLGDGEFVWRHLEASFVSYGGALSIDLRGHGASGHDPEGRYTIEQHVQDVDAVFRALVTRPVVLVGHSLGAEVAIRLAAAAPERIRGLVIVDGGPDLERESLDHYREMFREQAWQYDSVTDYANLLIERLPLADASLIAELARNALQRSPAGVWRLKCDRLLADDESSTEVSDLWEPLKRVRCPILVIRGAASAVLPMASSERMVARLRRCTLRCVPNSGHAVMLENPRVFAAALRAFLDRVN